MIYSCKINLLNYKLIIGSKLKIFKVISIKLVFAVVILFNFNACTSTNNPQAINEEEKKAFILNEQIVAERVILGFINHKYKFPKGKYKPLISTSEGIYYVAPNVILINGDSPQPYGGLFISKYNTYGIWMTYPHSYMELYNNKELKEKQFILEKSISFIEY